MQFEILSTPQIIFGSGKFQSLGQFVQGFGSKLLIVASESILKKAGTQKSLDDALTKCDIEYTHFIVKGEPETDLIDHGVVEGSDFKAKVVVGLGGGSVIDAGKAIAGLIANGGSARDYMEVIGKGSKITRPPLPYIAFPTTAGTGSEVTKNAVVTAKDAGFKASIRSPLLVPKMAVIDPSLMLSVPPDVTASCGLDALTQLIEAYTSNKAQPVTDTLALLGIQKAKESLTRSYKDSNDLSAKEDMAMAALLSGICLTNAGLGAVHGFASPLGGLFPIPHGVICAALLAPTVQQNIDELKRKRPDDPVLVKYARLGEIFGDKTFSRSDEAHQALVKYLKGLTKLLKIPALSNYGLEIKNIPGVISKAKKTSSMKYNPIQLDDYTLYKILDQAL